MKNPVLKALSLSVLLLAAGSAADAQLTRTWVSNVGDDVNPCSRTAPCRTFAAALARTAAGGTINVLDPGSYGSVTINKAITIQGDGTFAGILASATNGIVVNAGAADVVILRGLHLEGGSTGLNGIRFLNGLALYVEGCTINAFSEKGIDFEPGGSSALFVKDTVVRNHSAGTGGGILIKPGVAGTATATLDDVNLERNLYGLRVEGNSQVSVRESVMTGSSSEGVHAFASGTSPIVNVIDSLVSLNGSGVKAEGLGAVVRIGGTSVLNNGAAGLAALSLGQIVSFGDNDVLGNTPDGVPTSTAGKL
ncbi:MAG TPA: right-handed parallel beta-helix repeat-containing protein [Thermoanaerobaculia bacterium]|nr:right-handed parallel beta-helix repeat-containing protein [Thermoanaerobaculia bacterium]